MTNISDKVSNLTPEKKAMLVAKLKLKKNADKKLKQNKIKTISINKDENYCFNLKTPGNFNSINFTNVEKINPKKNQVQIKSISASLNFRDLMIAMGLYPETPGVPSNMGSDYSGIITQCGEDVKEFKPGDEVIALSAGDFTEDGQVTKNRHFSAYPNVSQYQVTKKPINLSFEEAACIPTVFLTAYYSLVNLANLKKNENVLIHTATGGVGQAAIQIAKFFKANIFTTAGNNKKRDYLKSIGIKNPMDSRSLEFADEIKAFTESKGVDVILNTLSGDAIEKGLDILNFFGRFIHLDKKDIAENFKLPLKYFNKGLTFATVDLALFLMSPMLMKKMFNDVIDHFEAGNFLPIPFKSYDIFDIANALTFMSKAKHIGKIVVNFTQ